MQTFPDYMDSVIAGVATLTLPFIPDCEYDPAEWSLRRFDRSGEVYVHKADFDFFERFPSIQSLGIITRWSHEIDACQLFLRISAATRHLRIKTLTTNVMPDKYPEFGWGEESQASCISRSPRTPIRRPLSSIELRPRLKSSGSQTLAVLGSSIINQSYNVPHEDGTETRVKIQFSRFEHRPLGRGHGKCESGERAQVLP